MIYLWTCILWMIGVAQAGEITLWYSTDLEEAPSVMVEQHGAHVYPVPERSNMVGDFHVWSIAWDGESDWVNQVHIDHADRETVSTVVMGRVDEQELFLLNDTTSKIRQWTSTTGGLEQTQTLERWHRQKYLLWFSVSGFLCLLLGWLKPRWSAEPMMERVLKVPFWLSAFVSFVFFVACSLWLQRSVLGLEGIPAVYHDALGSYWMMGRAGGWEGFFDSSTQYPQGTNYQSLDSYTLWLSIQVFDWLEPHVIYGVWIVLCPALSALSADLLAREWNVKSPWSLLAGLVFGFSGLVQNALLEGQIYQTLLVGLPCLAISIRRFQVADSFTWIWWLVSVFSFALCMFTSSYIGASALLLLIGWWIGSKGWKDPRTVYIALGVLPILWVQYQSMSAVGGLGVRDAIKVSIGSLSWDNFWGASPELFRERHAIALGLSIVGFVLFIHFICGVIQKRILSKWASILWMGGVSLLFALGPMWQVDSGSGWIFPLMEWVYDLPGISSIGFPIRLAQPFVLMVAVLSAAGLQKLVHRTPLALLLLPLSMWQIELMDFSDRQKVWSIESPVLNFVPDDKAIFTLYPQAYERNQGSDADIELYMQDCLAQVSHGHPITNHCISVDVHGSNTKEIQKQVLKALLDHRSVWDVLNVRGIEYLVVYPELFLPVDRIRMQRSLERDAILIEEGTRPLQYWVYEQDTDADQQPDLPEESITSSVTIDLWTSKDYASPVLMLGDGVLQESHLSSGEQFIRHRFQLDTQRLSMPITLQNSDGVVFWDDVLHFNPLNDHIVIREGEGQQMELPLLDSPYVSSDVGGVHGLLFGSMLAMMGVFSIVGHREDSLPKE